jgi:Tfp pilus assembly protein FimT
MHRVKNRGFSLVEMLVYVFVLTLFSLLVVESLLGMSGSYRRLVAARAIANSGVVSMERMTREIRNATDVNVLLSTLDAPSGRLHLVTSNDDGYMQNVSFALEEGVINVYRNDILVGPLTVGRASTTQLVFRVYESGRSKAVGIEMALEAASGSYIRTTPVTAFILLRNSR